MTIQTKVTRGNPANDTARGSGSVTKLPTAATSYYTVNKAGRYFYVVLVTPSPGKSLKTRLYRLTDKQHAHDVARGLAEDMKRPFKVGGKVQ